MAAGCFSLAEFTPRMKVALYTPSYFALPFVFAGLRVGATLSMVGALAGEFLAADRGLGFLINQANGLYDTALVMAGILAIVMLALSLNAGVRALESALS